MPKTSSFRSAKIGRSRRTRPGALTLFERTLSEKWEKWAKIHFAIDPAKRNAYKQPDTSATTDR